MEVLMRNEKGEALACKCKLCGRFTLDVKQRLCAACSLANFLNNFLEIIDTGGDERGHVKKEDDGDRRWGRKRFFEIFGKEKGKKKATKKQEN